MLWTVSEFTAYLYPPTRDFYLNLFYDNKRLEATAINTTAVAMLVFLMMGLILYLGVRLVLEKTITGPTNQLLGDVRAFVENDHQVPLREQQSQELDQLYQAIHEMTVAIQESRKRQLDQLEERLQMRSKLEIADALGHISHEINRYLGAIRISAEFLRLLPDQDPKPQLLQIEASVDKCAGNAERGDAGLPLRSIGILQPQEIIERATSSLPVPGADPIKAGLLHQRGRSLFFPQPDQ
jgi:signal transduction histidine kinase